MPKETLLGTSIAFAAVACIQVLRGQSSAVDAAPTRYPHVDAAIGYKVDASWPSERLPGDVWGGMSGITVGPDGNVWTFNRGKVPVQVYTPAGKLVKSWDTNVFKNPHTLRFDREGYLWASDSYDHTIRKFTQDGKLLLTLGIVNEPGNDATHFNQPSDLAFGPNGEIYVADGYGNSRVVVFDQDGHYLRSWGKAGNGPGEFSLVHSIVLDSHERVFVADRNNARVQVFNKYGEFLSQWTNVIIPYHLNITKNDEIYIAGTSPMLWADNPKGTYLGVPAKDQLFMKFDTEGRIKQLWTFRIGVKNPGELDGVHSMAVGEDGSLYFGDTNGHRAQKFVPVGAIGGPDK